MKLELVYTNQNGERLILNEEALYFLQNAKGLEVPENVVLAEEVFGKGDTKVVGIRLSIRKSLLEDILIGKAEEEIYQLCQGMIQKIDLKQTGRLTLKVYDREYETDVLPVQAPGFKLYENSPYKADEWNLFPLQFEALDFYLRDVPLYNSLAPLATLKSVLTFPMIFAQGKKYTSGRFEPGNIEKTVNSGDVQVGTVFYMKCVTTVTDLQTHDVIRQAFFGSKGTLEPGTRFEPSTVRGNLYTKKIVNGVETNAVPERMNGGSFS